MAINPELIAKIGIDASDAKEELKATGKAAKDMGADFDKMKEDVDESVAKVTELSKQTDNAAVSFDSMKTAVQGLGAILVAAGITQAIGAFKDSAEALFRSFGEEGQRVWEDVEKALFKVKGAFAEVVLGGGDVYELGGKLKAIFEGVGQVATVILAPVGAFGDLLYRIFDAFVDLDIAAAKYTDTLRMQTAAIDENGQAISSNQAAMTAAMQAAEQLVSTQQELAIGQYEQQIATFEAQRKAMQDVAVLARAKQIADSGAIDTSRRLFGIQADTIEINRRRYVEEQAAIMARRELMSDDNALFEAMSEDQRDRYLMLGDAADLAAQRRAEAMELLYNPPPPPPPPPERQGPARRAGEAGEALAVKGPKVLPKEVLAAMQAAEAEKQIRMDAAREAQRIQEEQQRALAEKAAAAQQARKEQLMAEQAAEVERLMAPAKAAQEAMTSLGEQASASARDAAGSISTYFGQAFAGILSGAKKTDQSFGDMAKSMAAQMAGTFAQLFTSLGTGMLFVNPAAGIGLIAAGLALSTLASLLGGETKSAKGAGTGTGAPAGPAAPSANNAPRNVYLVQTNYDMFPTDEGNLRRFAGMNRMAREAGLMGYQTSAV